MIYNGSKLHICNLPVLDTVWPMGLMFESASDFSALDETFFKAYIRTLPEWQPHAKKILLDLEGTPSANEDVPGQRYWWWDEYPTETVQNFDNAITWAKEVNEEYGLGLEFGLYGWPKRLDDANIAARETAMAPVIAKCDFISCASYWSNSLWDFAFWQGRTNIQASSISSYHTSFAPDQVYAYVSDRTSATGSKVCTPAEYTQVLDDIIGRGWNPVFWTYSNRTNLPFNIKAAMWAKL